MQNVSSSNSKGGYVPKLRFKDENGLEFPHYQCETVRTLFAHISRRNANMTNNNVITNSSEFGLIPQLEFFDKDIAVEENTDKYYVIEQGDFVYNPRKSTTAPYGPFNCYMGKEEGIVSPLYACLKPLYAEYTNYLLWYFRSSAWYSYIYHNGTQGGARHDRVGMNNELMDGIPVNLPSLREQEKVSCFLSTLEKRIEKQRQFVELLKLYKRGLLSKLFPQKGESVPQYRFTGFTDAWEQRKFGDILISLQNNTLSRAELSANKGVAKNVHYGDILVKFGEVLIISKEQLPMIIEESVLNKFQNSFLQNGDVVIADTAEDSAVGKCCEIAGLTDDIVISGLHTIPYRPKVKFASGYLGYYLNSNVYHQQLFPLMQGIKVTSISKSAMQNTDIIFPKSLEEQEKIGEYFLQLDNLITMHQRKYDFCKKVKFALLQQMFI